MVRKWKEIRMKWHQALGFGEQNYRFHDHDKLAHYANAATDIEYKFPFGQRSGGYSFRTDFDLASHQKFSGKKIQYLRLKPGILYPYVIETSIGVDRMFLQIISASYDEKKLRRRRDHGYEGCFKTSPCPRSCQACNLAFDQER